MKSPAADVNASLRSLVLKQYICAMTTAVPPRDIMSKLISSLNPLASDAEIISVSGLQPHVIAFKDIVINMVDASEIDIVQYEALIRLNSLERNQISFKIRSELVYSLCFYLLYIECVHNFDFFLI